MAFEGACIGAFADSAGLLVNKDNVESAAGEGGGGSSLALWGMRNVVVPVDLHCRQFVLLLLPSPTMWRQRAGLAGPPPLCHRLH